MATSGTQTLSCTVIICTYSNERISDLDACLQGLAAQTPPPDEVLVVVDHNDALLAILQQRDGLTALANTKTKGLSGARNSGVAAASGDIVVFLDDDAVPEPNWLVELLRPFVQAHVAGVGGHIVPAWPTQRPWWFPDHLDWTIGCSIPTLPPNGGEIRNVFGASAAFRRDELVRSGGFPTELGRVGQNGAGCEETDLCIRIRQQSPTATIVYAPKSTVMHRVTNERATVRYVLRRCFAEGGSKARLARRVGSGDATGDERTYALIIGRRVALDVITAVRYPARLGRAFVLVGGLTCASGGYVKETIVGRRRLLAA